MNAAAREYSGMGTQLYCGKVAVGEISVELRSV